MTNEANIRITNGNKMVSLGIKNETSTIALALTPNQARALAIALINGAANVREGLWGGPDYISRDRARDELER
jgi:hypothetical protein